MLTTHGVARWGGPGRLTNPVEHAHEALPGLPALGLLIQYTALLSAVWHVYGLRFSDYAVLPEQRPVLVAMHLTGILCAMFHWLAGLPLVRGRGKALAWMILSIVASVVFVAVWYVGSAHFQWVVPTNLKRHQLAFDDGLRGMYLDRPLIPFEPAGMLTELFDHPHGSRAVLSAGMIWTLVPGGLVLWPRARRTLNAIRAEQDVRGFDGVAIVFLAAGMNSMLLRMLAMVTSHVNPWTNIFLGFFGIFTCMPRLVGGIRSVLISHPTVLGQYARYDTVVVLVRAACIAVFTSIASTSILTHPTMIADMVAFGCIPFFHRDLCTIPKPAFAICR